MPRLAFRKRLCFGAGIRKTGLGSHSREVPGGCLDLFRVSLLPHEGEVSRPVKRLSDTSVSPRAKGLGGDRAASILAPYPVDATSHWFNRPHCRDKSSSVLTLGFTALVLP